MADSMNLNKAFELNRKMWAKIVAYAVPQIKKRTEGGRDREGKGFPAYSREYAKLKSRGFTRLTNRTGNKGTKLKGYERTRERQTSPPNFAARRETTRDLSPIAISRDSASIGWRGEYATIVSAHEQRKKYRIGGITKKEHEQVVKIADDFMVRQWNRKTKNIVVRVGV